MKPRTHKANESKEYFFEEGCFILELLNDSNDPDLSIARARVLPGEQTRLHVLESTAERYCIVSGVGRVEIGDHPPEQVETGDVVTIPPGCAQRIKNIGEEDLIFLAICSPRFTPGAYHDIEDSPGAGR